MIKRFAVNAAGRDFVVGDIHGCFRKLEAELATLGFDPKVDRLFSVGDLVDRGPDSELATEWLKKPWFHAVRGNHEQMAIDCAAGDIDPGLYQMNGGAWFMGMTKAEQKEIAAAFSTLPIAMEVETQAGVFGVVHADCPFESWARLADELVGHRAQDVANACVWSRARITARDETGVNDVAGVFVGHTPVQQPIKLGNVYYIDTGAVFGKPLTIVQIN